MIEVGISGWKYQGWRGTFYPSKLPQKKELEYASRQLPSIEINTTFYHLPRPSSFYNWYHSTPEGFVFAVKGNRYITHVKKLNDIRVPLANFFASGIFHLKEKLGPILWQFPPGMSFDPDKFETFLSLLPHDTREAKALAQDTTLPKERTYFMTKENLPLRHAVEVRNYSFLNPWFIELLRKYKVALVFADTAGRWPYMEDLTSDFIYIRLHGDEELYVSGYDDADLEFWSKRISAWQAGGEAADRLTITDDPVPRKKRDVYVYFDNDAKVRAPRDAQSLLHKLFRPPQDLVA